VNNLPRILHCIVWQWVEPRCLGKWLVVYVYVLLVLCWWQDSNQMHAVCLDTFPPVSYLTDTSHAIIRLVHAINKHFDEYRVSFRSLFGHSVKHSLILFYLHVLTICVCSTDFSVYCRLRIHSMLVQMRAFIFLKNTWRWFWVFSVISFHQQAPTLDRILSLASQARLSHQVMLVHSLPTRRK